MGGVFCSDKPDSLTDKPDTFEQERDEEGVTGPSYQKALLLYSGCPMQENFSRTSREQLLQLRNALFIRVTKCPQNDQSRICITSSLEQGSGETVSVWPQECSTDSQKYGA